MQFTKVDLPHPFGPMRAWISCGRTDRVAPWSARIPPKDLLTPEATRIGSLVTDESAVLVAQERISDVG